MDFVVFLCAWRTHVSTWPWISLWKWRLEDGSRGAGPLCGLRRRAACFLFRLSFGPQLLDPMLLLLGKMYTLGIKIITSTQHRRGAGWREGREDGGGEQDRGTKTNQTKITTLKASTYQNVRPWVDQPAFWDCLLCYRKMYRNQNVH